MSNTTSDTTTMVRTGDPVTSFEAAEKAAVGKSAVRAVVLQIIRAEGPMTHDDMNQAYRQLVIVDPSVPRASDSGLRTRLRELVDAGLVAAHPCEFSVSRFGNRATLWCAVEADGTLTGVDPNAVPTALADIPQDLLDGADRTDTSGDDDGSTVPAP